MCAFGVQFTLLSSEFVRNVSGVSGKTERLIAGSLTYTIWLFSLILPCSGINTLPLTLNHSHYLASHEKTNQTTLEKNNQQTQKRGVSRDGIVSNLLIFCKQKNKT